MSAQHAFGLFLADSGAIAVPADGLVQVLEDGLRRRLPGAPVLAPAVIEFQGRLVPLLDLQLGGTEADAVEAQPLAVICTTRRGTVGFPVRRVRQVAAVAEGNFVAAGVDENRPWLTGGFEFHNEQYLVIDLDRLVEVLPG